MLENALKYTRKGDVWVAVCLKNSNNRSIQARKANTKAMLRVVVQDSGVGFEEREKFLLFGEYCQLPSNKWMSQGGSGLGLSFCNKVVQKLGGSIWATTNSFGGSTFGFEIPVVLAEPTTKIVDSMSQVEPCKIETEGKEGFSNWQRLTLENDTSLNFGLDSFGGTTKSGNNSKILFVE